MSKKRSVTVFFPRDLLKKVDEHAFTKITSRSDFLRSAVNDFFVREEKQREGTEHYGNQKDK